MCGRALKQCTENLDNMQGGKEAKHKWQEHQKLCSSLLSRSIPTNSTKCDTNTDQNVEQMYFTHICIQNIQQICSTQIHR